MRYADHGFLDGSGNLHLCISFLHLVQFLQLIGSQRLKAEVTKVNTFWYIQCLIKFIRKTCRCPLLPLLLSHVPYSHSETQPKDKRRKIQQVNKYIIKRLFSLVIRRGFANKQWRDTVLFSVHSNFLFNENTQYCQRGGKLGVPLMPWPYNNNFSVHQYT